MAAITATVSSDRQLFICAYIGEATRIQITQCISLFQQQRWPPQHHILPLVQVLFMEHITRQKIHKNEHEKKVHKLNHHEQQDLIATPWQIWERADEDEYIEPDYIKDTDNKEGTEAMIAFKGVRIS